MVLGVGCVSLALVRSHPTHGTIALMQSSEACPGSSALAFHRLDPLPMDLLTWAASPAVPAKTGLKQTLLIAAVQVG